MKEITDIVYHFSEKELLVLLASAGVEQLPCFQGKYASVAEIAEEEYNRVLFGLAKRGLVESRGDALYMPEPYAQLFRTIRQRRMSLSLKFRDRLVYFYIGKGLSAVEAQSAEEVGAHVRLGYLEEEALSERIREELPRADVPDSVYKEDGNELPAEEAEECGEAELTDGREEKLAAWKFYEWKGKLYTEKEGEEEKKRFRTDVFYEELMQQIENDQDIIQ